MAAGIRTWMLKSFLLLCLFLAKNHLTVLYSDHDLSDAYCIDFVYGMGGGGDEGHQEKRNQRSTNVGVGHHSLVPSLPDLK